MLLQNRFEGMAAKLQQISPILDFLDRYLSDGGYRPVFSAIHNEKAEKRRKNRFPIGTDVIRVDTAKFVYIIESTMIVYIGNRGTR